MPITSVISCSAAPAADIFVQNGSLDISITAVSVDGIPVTYSSGSNFPVTAGNNGNFTTALTGTGKTVSISYSSSISGQNIYFYDSDFTGTCENVSGFGGSFSVFNAVINFSTASVVNASDGACF
jgi:hypothetical protein